MKENLEYCKSKKIGEFYYNPDEFRFCDGVLYYIGKETDGSKIKIPKGIKSCYSMFFRCENLKTAPEIPEGVKNCMYMFADCKNLKTAPQIPNGVEDCTSMFEGCESLKTPPIIGYGIKNCKNMFLGCISLTKAPKYPKSIIWFI